MKVAIITHVKHIHIDNEYFGYAPYIQEMNIWLKYVSEAIIVAPLVKGIPTAIDISYQHEKIELLKISSFDITTFNNFINATFKFPVIFWKVFLAMKKADHIHLRCPGNLGLIGCIVQILFPKKVKTAKYAGNWDPKSKQPWTYKLQKWILSNTFLTRNMQVLVYGEWENQSKNIKPFFTATYSEHEKENILKKDVDKEAIFVFVGALSIGKDAMYAVKLIELLTKNKNNVILNIYGEGEQRNFIEAYIKDNHLLDVVFLHGNQNKETIKKAYQKSHFVILPSKSEGWPKVIAEGMFWNCIPIATKVSCVPFMLDYGNRGILLKMNLKKDFNQIETILKNELGYLIKSKKASDWSRKYTLDLFENEIKELLIK